ncbi:DUF3738 domain-containing protein [Bremerella cremea]|uniref:DUF3738 domain-containing protein n=1 Tax=Bremerella cremea TaxID=1031537 RepID=A0A368KQG9_9BACT|nr:M56 family metallopeptidase [Bremerella cremea]RCS48308.1 DUF3738 domain-containing protein [Bremerella cremea]
MNVDTLLDACGWTLLHFLWQGAVLGLLLFIALQCLPFARPQVRYTAACTALAGMAALVLLTFAWEVAQPAVVASVEETKLLEASEPSAEPVPPANHAFESASVLTKPTSEPPAPSEAVPLTPAIAAQSTWYQQLSTALTPWLDWLVLLWLAGVALLTLRLGVNWVAVQRLRGQGLPIAEGRWLDPLARLRHRLQVHAEVSLVHTATIAVPMVLGWLRPVILVPTEMVAGLTPGQLEAILAHELAHIRRYDYAVNLLQNLAETVLFFHPAVWWASAQIRKERECCCDAMAAQLCHGPLPYSQALLAVETFRSNTPLAVAANGGSLLQRIRRLSGQPARSPQAAGAMLLLLVAIGLASLFALEASQAAADEENVAAAMSDEEATKLAVAAHAKARAIDRLPRFYCEVDYRNGDVSTMTEVDRYSLENLRKAMTEPVPKEKWIDNHDIFAWDRKQALFESHSPGTKNDDGSPADYHQLMFGNLTEAWCKEYRAEQTPWFYRRPDFQAFWETSTPLTFQFIIATPRKFWWGDNDHHGVSHNTVPPSMVRYRHLGKEEIEGELCDIVESKGRAERLWIGRETGLIRAVLHYKYMGRIDSGFYQHPTVKKIAGQTFTSDKEYRDWSKQYYDKLPPFHQAELGNAFYESRFDEMARPSKYVLFRDYREITSGVWVPFVEDRTAWLYSQNDQNKFRYFRAESRVKKCSTDVDLTQRIEELRPQEGDFVQDQRVAGAVVEYKWREEIAQAEIDHLVQQKQLELQENQQLLDKLKAPLQKLVGQAAPPLTDGKWLGEKPQLSGKPTLIHFWAAWCGPCKNDYELLNRIAKKGQVIGIHPAGTPEDEVAAAIEAGQHTYPTFLSAENKEGLVGGYPVKMYPYCVVLDSAGRVAAHGSLFDVASTFHELNDAAKKDDPPATQPKTAEKSQMTVLVTDAQGHPLAGARVFQNQVYQLAGSDKPTIKNHEYYTDGGGKVVITWPGESRDLRLWVSQPEYVPLHAMWSRELQADGDKLPAEFRFQLTAATTIGGRVLDANGKPIAGAKIEIQNGTAGLPVRSGEPGQRPVAANWLAAEASAILTNSQGRWTANNIPSDRELTTTEARRNTADGKPAAEPSPKRNPLRLRVTHPDFQTFDMMANPKTTDMPTLEQLRKQDATVVLKAPDDKMDAPAAEEKQADEPKLSFAERQRKIKQEAAPYLAAMIEAGYRLSPDENLKRIAPPFPQVRHEWYRTRYPRQYELIPKGPDLMTFHWSDNKLENWGLWFGGQSLGTLLEDTLDLYPQNVEAPKDFLQTQLSGDWVIRPEAKGAGLLSELETILNDQLQLNIRMRFADIERDVYVMKGKYQFKPLPEFTPEKDASRYDKLQIFGALPYPNSGAGGGSGTFQKFNQWLGRWIKEPIVIEATDLPKSNISWQLHAPSPATPAELQMAHDPNLVLATISSQTGLEFVKEKRKIRMLVIEPLK